jgi:hypothetical protein
VTWRARGSNAGASSLSLGYTDGQTDELEWELFTPREIREAVGLRCVYEDASPDAPRMIHVFER